MNTSGITYGPIDRWPRALTKSRKRSPFRADYNGTMRLLQAELYRAGARGAVVQLALDRSQFRVSDGKPYANAIPSHPGVIVSFTKGKEPLAFPCDAYLTWIENLRAIALALEALRKVDRYGVTKHGEQYRGWNALPPAASPIAAAMTVEDAARWLGNEGGPVPWGDVIGRSETYKAAYRRAALRFHPDANGGTARAEWATLDVVKGVLDRHHGL